MVGGECRCRLGARGWLDEGGCGAGVALRRDVDRKIGKRGAGSVGGIAVCDGNSAKKTVGCGGPGGGRGASEVCGARVVLAFGRGGGSAREGMSCGLFPVGVCRRCGPKTTTSMR